MSDGIEKARLAQRLERTDLIADGVYLAHLGRRLGWSADYKKLLSSVQDNCTLGEAFFFTVVKEVASSGPTNGATAALKRLIGFLGSTGYTVETRWIEKRGRAMGNDLYTAAVNIALCLEDCSRRGDDIILVSGDIALLPAIERALVRGSRVTVIADESDPRVAELQEAASAFVSLESLRAGIERTERGEA